MSRKPLPGQEAHDAQFLRWCACLRLVYTHVGLPDKLEGIEDVVQKYAGHERELLDQAVQKYTSHRAFDDFRRDVQRPFRAELEAIYAAWEAPEAERREKLARADELLEKYVCFEADLLVTARRKYQTRPQANGTHRAGGVGAGGAGSGGAGAGGAGAGGAVEQGGRATRGSAGAGASSTSGQAAGKGGGTDDGGGAGARANAVAGSDASIGEDATARAAESVGGGSGSSTDASPGANASASAAAATVTGASAGTGARAGAGAGAGVGAGAGAGVGAGASSSPSRGAAHAAPRDTPRDAQQLDIQSTKQGRQRRRLRERQSQRHAIDAMANGASRRDSLMERVQQQLRVENGLRRWRAVKRQAHLRALREAGGPCGKEWSTVVEDVQVAEHEPVKWDELDGFWGALPACLLRYADTWWAGDVASENDGADVGGDGADGSGAVERGGAGEVGGDGDEAKCSDGGVGAHAAIRSRTSLASAGGGGGGATGVVSVAVEAAAAGAAGATKVQSSLSPSMRPHSTPQIAAYLTATRFGAGPMVDSTVDSPETIV
eukprot:g1023.t1